MTTDEKYIRRCIELASNGLCNAAPNPMVGAVIVHNGKIIGEGLRLSAKAIMPDAVKVMPKSMPYVP